MAHFVTINLFLNNYSCAYTQSKIYSNLFLVDEDDDGRLDAGVEDADQLVPLVVLFAHVHNLEENAF